MKTTNSIGALLEFCQPHGLTPTLEVVNLNNRKGRQGSHRGKIYDRPGSSFACRCTIGDRKFPTVNAPNKQKGKQEAFQKALDILQNELPPPPKKKKTNDVTQVVRATSPKQVRLAKMEPTADAAQPADDPISVITNMAIKDGLTARLEILKTFGPPHKPSFECCCVYGSKTFPSVVAGSKKEGKQKAFQLALNMINGISEAKAENEIINPESSVSLRSEETFTSLDTEEAAQQISLTMQSLQQSNADSTGGAHSSKLVPSHDTLKVLNKQPISAFLEFGQARALQPTIKLVQQSGPSHCPKFEMRCCFKNRQFPSVYCRSLKEARTAAAEVALKCLMAEGSFAEPKSTNQAEAAACPDGPQTNISTERARTIADLVVKKFTEIQGQLLKYSMGKVILAGLVLEQADGNLHVISLGTGNRCITGDQLSLDGSTVNDCHAEIITRRGFIRFLCVELRRHIHDKDSSIFSPSASGKLELKPGIKFHLYISTAPCGDGALFTPSDHGITSGQDEIAGKHRPIFTSDVHGLLRTKVETGEGTIPIPDDVGVQTFDGLIRGDNRLRTMSCSDKICRWNVLGMQGALISNFVEPIYLSSLTLGQLFNAGHLSRALCCRVNDLSSQLPGQYVVNHVDLGWTGDEVPRGTAKTKSISVNWSFHDGKIVEVLDGTKGKPIEEQRCSRVSKQQIYNNFKRLCLEVKQQHLVEEGYLKAKQGCPEYVKTRDLFYQQFLLKKKGVWVRKPSEEQMFR